MRKGLYFGFLLLMMSLLTSTVSARTLPCSAEIVGYTVESEFSLPPGPDEPKFVGIVVRDSRVVSIIGLPADVREIQSNEQNSRQLGYSGFRPYKVRRLQLNGCPILREVRFDSLTSGVLPSLVACKGSSLRMRSKSVSGYHYRVIEFSGYLGGIDFRTNIDGIRFSFSVLNDPLGLTARKGMYVPLPASESNPKGPRFILPANSTDERVYVIAEADGVKPSTNTQKAALQDAWSKLEKNISVQCPYIYEPQ